MRDRALAEAALAALDAAIAGLFAARKMLTAALDTESGCVHRNRVSVATFDKPEAWMCPDCGEEG